MWQYWKKVVWLLQIYNGCFTQMNESWPMGLLFCFFFFRYCDDQACKRHIKEKHPDIYVERYGDIRKRTQGKEERSFFCELCGIMLSNYLVSSTAFSAYLSQSLVMSYRQPSLLSHLLVAGCDIGVRFSVSPSVRPSVNIYVDVRHLCQS